MTSWPTTASSAKALSMVLIATTVLACGGAPGGTVATREAGGSPQAGAVGDPNASHEPQSPSSGLCDVFTPAELAPFLGAQAASGSSGGPLDSSCEWDVGDTYVMIQKVPVDYFEDRRGAEGYRELDEIGEYAYVAPHPFGTITAAMTADAGYLVIASDGADEAAQIEILRTFIERSPGAPSLATPDLPAQSDAPAASSASGAIDCPVTTEEVREAVGMAMNQSEGCSWAAADAGIFFEVLVADVQTTLFEYLREQEYVDGLGDEAYLDTGILYVRVGDRAISISVITLSLDEGEASNLAVAVARYAVQRLR